MNKKRVTIIPLGENCLPRTILTRWKIKPKKLFGEPTFPFDLAVFGMPEITKSLKTDFKEFFDDLEYSKERNCWIKSPNCIYFCHENNLNENEKQKLIKIYTKRIENFRKVILNSTPIVFVQNTGDFEDIENQYIEIKRLRNQNPFRFIIIDTQNTAPKLNHKEIKILKLKYPSSDYKNNWWKKEYFKSVQGKTFEKTIANFCLSVMNELQNEPQL